MIGEKQKRQKFMGLDKVVCIASETHLLQKILKERQIVDKVLQGRVQTKNTLVTNAWYYHALKEVQKSILDIKASLDKKLSGDLLAPDIRRCLPYLGEIAGEVTNEEQLDYIFSKFCI